MPDVQLAAHSVETFTINSSQVLEIAIVQTSIFACLAVTIMAQLIQQVSYIASRYTFSLLIK